MTNRIERVLYAMTEYGEVYADRYVDEQGRAWVAPCGTPLRSDAWTPDAQENAHPGEP